MSHLNYNHLYYFWMTQKKGSVTQAAEALFLTPQTVTGQIKLLEQRLGVRLLQRSTRRFSVTEVGQDFYVHCKAMLAEAEAATDAVALSRSEPRGVVRFTCPVALLQARIGAMVADFLVQCPRVTVHVRPFNRPVDVIADGYDFAIRVRPLPLEDSDLVLKKLATRKQCLVASPMLLEQWGTPSVPADLARMPSLALGPAAQEHVWQLEGLEGAQAAIRHEPRLITDDMNTLRTAAVAGVGVTCLPQMMVDAEIRAGRLITLLPEWAPPPHLIHAVLPSKRFVLPSVRALVDYLAERFAAIEEE